MSVEEWSPEQSIANAWPAIELQLRRALHAGDAIEELVAYVSDLRGADGVRDVTDVGVLSRTVACEVLAQGDARNGALLQQRPPAGHLWVLFASDSGAVIVATACATILRDAPVPRIE